MRWRVAGCLSVAALHAFHAHGAVLELARQEQRAAAAIDPGLVPQAIVAIEEIEALALAALRAGPVFEQRAAIENEFDAVVTRRLSVLRHAPLSDPEIELARRARPCRRASDCSSALMEYDPPSNNAAPSANANVRVMRPPQIASVDRQPIEVNVELFRGLRSCREVFRASSGSATCGPIRPREPPRTPSAGAEIPCRAA